MPAHCQPLIRSSCFAGRPRQHPCLRHHRALSPIPMTSYYAGGRGVPSQLLACSESFCVAGRCIRSTRTKRTSTSTIALSPFPITSYYTRGRGDCAEPAATKLLSCSDYFCIGRPLHSIDPNKARLDLDLDICKELPESGTGAHINYCTVPTAVVHCIVLITMLSCYPILRMRHSIYCVFSVVCLGQGYELNHPSSLIEAWSRRRVGQVRTSTTVPCSLLCPRAKYVPLYVYCVFSVVWDRATS